MTPVMNLLVSGLRKEMISRGNPLGFQGRFLSAVRGLILEMQKLEGEFLRPDGVREAFRWVNKRYAKNN
jgi:hypothetical protein